jgi:Zn-dependent protease
MLISIREILDMVIMTLFVGFIFGESFIKPAHYAQYKDPLDYYGRKKHSYWSGFMFAIFATVPAIVFHELAHKFAALALGMNAVFHAAYTWLGIGLVLKLLNFPFIFFVPAFVQISGGTSAMNHAIIAFAGPALNLSLFIISFLILKFGKVNKKYVALIVMTKKINLFLFFFNMIPIPPFDGYSVFSNLYYMLF